MQQYEALKCSSVERGRKEASKPPSSVCVFPRCHKDMLLKGEISGVKKQDTSGKNKLWSKMPIFTLKTVTTQKSLCVE